jgi:nucleotide-binding universal stress UspA family protein
MINLKRILCPTDLSPESGDALNYALALSRTYGAELVLLYCESRTNAHQTQPSSDGKQRNVLEALLYEQTGHAAGSRCRTLIVETDDIGAEITRVCEAENADLIVMRSRRRPHRAALLGSTAETVCRTAPCPVLVMHSDEQDWSNGGLWIDLKRILVAYDFSDFSELALSYGLSLAREYQAELHILHVLPPGSVREPEIAWYPSQGESPYRQAALRLQRAMPAEAHLCCTLKHVVSEGNPYREILNYAETNGIDLVAVGAHGAGFGMRTLFGSNVDRVLRQAPCPVLVARALKPAVISRELERCGSFWHQELRS